MNPKRFESGSKPEDLRPVNPEVHKIVGKIPNGKFNFGLYFHKWFYISQFSWKCPTDNEKNKNRDKIWLTDNMKTSLGLFNGREVGIDSAKGSWRQESAKSALQHKHERLEQAGKIYERMGYRYLPFRVEMLAPLVIGLGNEHPTEKGFRFDWNLGIPAIPASSIKGVVRLAYLVNELNTLDENNAEDFWKDMCKDRLPDEAQQMFGCGEVDKQTARQGKVIFFDAFPYAVPRLKSEIMNCHYPDYLNNDPKRGPTEDQQPNPQKFWAVDTSADDKGTPLTFVFRVLLHKSIAENENLFSRFEKAFASALEDHGFGAKTAIGHGRFQSKRGKADEIGPNNGQSIGAAAQIRKIDPAKVREEKMSSFRKQLAGCKNLPGEINRFLENVKAQEDRQLQQEMCRAIAEKGESLDKKKRFSKALILGSKWAIDLKNLCESCGLNLQDKIKIG